MTDPKRLIVSSSSRVVTELLAAGRLEEPSPELIERFTRTAALGLTTAVVLEHSAARVATELTMGHAQAAGGSAAGTSASATSLTGATSASAAGTTTALGAAGTTTAGLTGSAAGGAVLAGAGVSGAALVKWVSVGVLGLAAAAGAPNVLHWVEQSGPSASSSARPPARLEPAPATAFVPTRAPTPPAAHAPHPLETIPPSMPPVPSKAPLRYRHAPLDPSVSPARERAAPKVAAQRARPESKGGPSHSPAEPSTLGPELASVDRARVALARGDARYALRELDSYERAYPKPQLQLEVSMLRMEAHVMLGELPQARDLARRILDQPVSPLHAARAREVLEGKTSAP